MGCAIWDSDMRYAMWDMLLKSVLDQRFWDKI